MDKTIKESVDLLFSDAEEAKNSDHEAKNSNTEEEEEGGGGTEDSENNVDNNNNGDVELDKEEPDSEEPEDEEAGGDEKSENPDDDSEEDSEEAKNIGQPEDPKKGRAEKRIRQLVEQKNEALSKRNRVLKELEEANKEREALRAELSKYEEATSRIPRPREDDFDSVEEFEKAFDEYEEKRFESVYAKRKKQEAEAGLKQIKDKEKAAISEVVSSILEEGVKQFGKGFEDTFSKVSEVTLNPSVAEGLLYTDNPAAIIQLMQRDPGILDRLKNGSAHSGLLFLGKLDEEITRGAASRGKNKVSKAPEPNRISKPSSSGKTKKRKAGKLTKAELSEYVGPGAIERYINDVT